MNFYFTTDYTEDTEKTGKFFTTDYAEDMEKARKKNPESIYARKYKKS